ncbi:hypothetical protein DFH09DRAFT_1106387 [Mycena vulgaris]|nr:hypothetical protein DFH09DRAFT_1106387 [Mycena vulgaris]
MPSSAKGRLAGPELRRLAPNLELEDTFTAQRICQIWHSKWPKRPTNGCQAVELRRRNMQPIFCGFSALYNGIGRFIDPAGPRRDVPRLHSYGTAPRSFRWPLSAFHRVGPIALVFDLGDYICCQEVSYRNLMFMLPQFDLAGIPLVGAASDYILSGDKSDSKRSMIAIEEGCETFHPIVRPVNSAADFPRRISHTQASFPIPNRSSAKSHGDRPSSSVHRPEGITLSQCWGQKRKKTGLRPIYLTADPEGLVPS